MHHNALSTLQRGAVEYTPIHPGCNTLLVQTSNYIQQEGDLPSCGKPCVPSECAHHCVMQGFVVC
eukprot:3188640-Amphidinium_carterae.1